MLLPPSRLPAPLMRPGTPAPGEASFIAWLEAELANSPGSVAYGDVYADAVAGIKHWRRRYRGNQALWRRLMRPERLVKEIVEMSPVLAAVSDYVAAAPGGPVTVVDLCSGKGYLSMLLAELLPPDRVRGCVLVDKAWPRHDVEVRHDHINPEHVWEPYRSAWPVPLLTSKLDLKKSCSRRALGTRWLSSGGADGADSGPVLLLGVHLCGTLSLRAIELFNAHEAVKLLALKPCCLPGIAHARRDETFRIGSHAFAAKEVAALGSFGAGGRWRGPPRQHLEARFERWAEHLLEGIEVDQQRGGAKLLTHAEIQVQGGYQNAFLFAERGQRTAALWDGLAGRTCRTEAVRLSRKTV